MPHCCESQHGHSAGVQPADYSTENRHLKAAETVQQIRLRPVEPSLKEPDLTLRRYNTKRDMRSMRKLQCLTDTRVVVEGCGQEWQVHALMLASASTVFRHILEDVQPTGKPCSLLDRDNLFTRTDSQTTMVLIWNTASCSTVLLGHGKQQLVYGLIVVSTHFDQIHLLRSKPDLMHLACDTVYLGHRDVCSCCRWQARVAADRHDS